MSGCVERGVISGPLKYLSSADEKELVRFLLGCAAIGYARSRKEVNALMQRVMEGSEIPRLVANGWWESFCRCHPNLMQRYAAPLSRARAAAWGAFRPKGTSPDLCAWYKTSCRHWVRR